MSKSIQWLCIMFVIIVPTISSAQDWVARYNGPCDSVDRAYAIAVDDAGFVYVTGWSIGSGTDYDYATVKYDLNGDTVWVRRYNGPGNGEDEETAMAVDDRGNVYVTGLSFVSAIDYDYATVKYDSAGVEQWVVWYDGLGNGYGA